eukprot:gnl/MRDRNA2_/MRDRNA2_157765_c0_seq1.p1 gnl/MRDRNA2_/MRDRNA2_157765_c0~~gnl/MRDRNA2_/MRDRNA2_157765_c0_seq1.p1  ORF type:complete len:287 (-),score=53.91 gnl/MRDRNA2_/MRDRNA2_157765_c0_seq1:165-1025(-)
MKSYKKRFNRFVASVKKEEKAEIAADLAKSKAEEEGAQSEKEKNYTVLFGSGEGLEKVEKKITTCPCYKVVVGSAIYKHHDNLPCEHGRPSAEECQALFKERTWLPCEPPTWGEWTSLSRRVCARVTKLAYFMKAHAHVDEDFVSIYWATPLSRVGYQIVTLPEVKKCPKEIMSEAKMTYVQDDSGNLTTTVTFPGDHYCNFTVEVRGPLDSLKDLSKPKNLQSALIESATSSLEYSDYDEHADEFANFALGDETEAEYSDGDEHTATLAATELVLMVHGSWFRSL